MNQKVTDCKVTDCENEAIEKLLRFYLKNNGAFYNGPLLIDGKITPDVPRREELSVLLDAINVFP